MKLWQWLYSKKILTQAYKAKTITGLPATVIAAQAILETGWGKSYPIDYMTGKDSKNLFGIKCTERDGDVVISGNNGYVECWTHEYINNKRTPVLAKFRAYLEEWDGFIDYADVIKHSRVKDKKTGKMVQRYAEALKCKWDPIAYIRAIHRAGYATNPDYADMVIAIMKQCRYIAR